MLALMRPGDILTHCYTGLTMKIVDDDGHLYDFAERAWDSGVVMDIGHGTGSFSYETAEALHGGRPPSRRDLDRPAPAQHQRARLRPADLPEQVPSPRDVAPRGRPGRHLPSGRGARAWSARSGHYVRARSPTSRSSACSPAAFRCTTSGARCGRPTACSSIPSRSWAAGRSSRFPLRRPHPGPSTRSGPRRRSRSPSGSRRCATAGTRRPRYGRRPRPPKRAVEPGY